jgi:hypothetical protein
MIPKDTATNEKFWSFGSELINLFTHRIHLFACWTVLPISFNVLCIVIARNEKRNPMPSDAIAPSARPG